MSVCTCAAQLHKDSIATTRWQWSSDSHRRVNFRRSAAGLLQQPSSPATRPTHQLRQRAPGSNQCSVEGRAGRRRTRCRRSPTRRWRGTQPSRRTGLPARRYRRSVGRFCYRAHGTDSSRPEHSSSSLAPRRRVSVVRHRHQLASSAPVSTVHCRHRRTADSSSNSAVRDDQGSAGRVESGKSSIRGDAHRGAG